MTPQPAKSFQDLILTLHQYWSAQGLRHSAALRHGSGRGHLSSGDDAARRRAEALGGGLRAALAPPQGWPLWRKSQSPAALLPVSGDHQAVAAGSCRSSIWARSTRSASIPNCMTSASSRTIGKARRSAPGGSAGKSGATAWKSRSSPTSSRWAASIAFPSPASSPTASSASPCMCRASTMSTI